MVGSSETMEIELNDYVSTMSFKSEAFEEEEYESHYTGRKNPHYTCKNFRIKAGQILGDKFNNLKNGKIVEKHVYNATIAVCREIGIPLKITNNEFQAQYASILYNVANSSENIKEIVKSLKNGLVEWDSNQFEKYHKEQQAEEASYVEEVEEGEVECTCGCAKIIKISCQTRSADEGATVFHKCIECKKIWKIYN